jgi:hypothetical protein
MHYDHDVHEGFCYTCQVWLCTEHPQWDAHYHRNGLTYWVANDRFGPPAR